MRLTIKNFTSGKNIKIFNTSDGIRLLDTYSHIHSNDLGYTTSGIERKYKYDFVYTPSLSGISPIPILQMYNDNALTIQSSVTTNNSQLNPQFLEEYLDMQSSGYISVAQYNNTILALTTNGRNVIQAKSIHFSQLGVPYYDADPSGYWDSRRALRDFPVYVGVYLPAVEFNLLLPDYKEDIIAPAYLLSGVDFNYLSEVNASSEYAHIDFDTAHLYANSLNMKNMYNENWDVSAYVSTSGDLGVNRAITSAHLDNSRVYTTINVAPNNVIWAKYQFGKYYSNNVPVEMVKRNLYDTEFDVTRRFKTSIIKPHIYKVYEIDNTPYLTSAHQYEHIERIKGFNTFASAETHKSNLFSINIHNSGFSTDTTQNRNIRNGINTIINNMIEKIVPAHTQLFNIYWTDTGAV